MRPSRAIWDGIERVAVGTALAGRPPRRSGRAAFPHPAPRSGHRVASGAVCHSAHHTVPRPCVRRMQAVEWHCPRAAAFPPSPPPRFRPICSETSQVLCSGPTAWVRSSPAFGHALPDAIGAGLLHRVDCSMTDTPRLSRFPRTMRLYMLRSATPPSVSTPCQSGMSTVAFHALGPCRHSKVAYFGAQY